MTLKEELEILRGEPIEVYEGDPMDIPCIETSDPERLCKHPVVSVHMLAYNHEPYIRQAIEGVMMQKTDFEFELVVGEDCSQDKTREICFEYQEKHPDKISVLWWHENVSKLGGNGFRTTAHCRGEFVAFCEGDDYWVDPLKLQKQVDIMHKHCNVSIVFTGSKILNQVTKKEREWNVGRRGYQNGLVTGKTLQLCSTFGAAPKENPGDEFFIMTCTLMLRKKALQEARNLYDILKWRLAVGDVTLILAMATMGDGYYLPENTGVYRQTPTGASSTNTERCAIDNRIVRMYFAMRVFGLKISDFPPVILDTIVNHSLLRLSRCPASKQREYIRRVISSPEAMSVFSRFSAWPACLALMLGIVNFTIYRVIAWYYRKVRRFRVSEKVLALYADGQVCQCK